ncbi:AGAP003703-PA-like protein [Anopheles sinensis]|uniref:AGAP003703-PA-like protein n=1 Tax=Anopheles sinensis TaxID=74873 RepID=A0A084VJA5_ANOSI|nr:AGAP003703-PA-like protein [Anopheles sinensis]
MAYKLNNNATEKGHASETAHSLDTLASHGYTATTSTSYLGLTAPTASHYGPTTQTIHALNIGHTALSTHTTPSSQTTVTKHSSFLGNTSPRNGTDAYTLHLTSSIPHMKDEQKFDRATGVQLLEANILIQRRFRTKRLLGRDREEFEQKKIAAVVIQCLFRGHHVMIRERDRFVAVRRAAVVIQQYFRAHVAMVQETQRFQQIRQETITMQARWRSTILMRAQRSVFQQNVSAVRIIQTHYRRYRADLETRTGQARFQYYHRRMSIVVSASWMRFDYRPGGTGRIIGCSSRE